VGLNLQNTLVVVLLCIEATLAPAASCQLAGTCCRLCLAIMEVVVRLLTLMEFVVVEVEDGCDVPPLSKDV
jgi:hypothetical protein